MPSELRHILFRPTEVIEALRSHQARIGQPIPRGQVLDSGPEGTGSSIRFRLQLSPEPADAFAAGLKTLRQEFVFDAPTLAAALIHYCRDRKIPLPVNAEKSVQQFGEQVGLITTYNVRPDTAPIAQHLRARA
jgi:hypothetical protein